MPHISIQADFAVKDFNIKDFTDDRDVSSRDRLTTRKLYQLAPPMKGQRLQDRKKKLIAEFMIERPYGWEAYEAVIMSLARSPLAHTVVMLDTGEFIVGSLDQLDPATQPQA